MVNVVLLFFTKMVPPQTNKSKLFFFSFQPVAFVTFESREEAEEAKASLQVRK